MQKVVEIPDNITNGEIIKALFPQAGIINIDNRHVFILIAKDCSLRTYLEWWNALYQKKGAEK